MSLPVKLFRAQKLDLAKGEWVDEFIPTETVKRRGWVRNVAAATLLASHYVKPGSPETVDRTWLITRARFWAGSPETVFSIVHSREGSIDQIYFESPGEQTDISQIGFVYAFPTGSVKAYLETPGSALRGFAVSLEGPEV